jgi:hypothetical protein
MKLRFLGLTEGDKPIASVEAYLEARGQSDDLSRQAHALQLEIKRQREAGQEPNPQLFKELNILWSQEDQVRYAFWGRQPDVLISRCPYCETLIWMRVGIFSLMDEFWYRTESDGREEVSKDSRCPHLFCVDGALNLNGYQPIEAERPITVVTNDTIWMAAEIPFVKPRVLNLPTMVAVIHSFPVAEKYTAYPIVYFTEQQPSQYEFCIAWARTEYVDHTGETGPGGGQVVMIGKRSDAQDYELEKWVEQGKLFWLDPEDEEHPLMRGSVTAFLYGNISGRKHPYTIKNGRARNLRNRTTDSQPRVRMEY